MKSFLPFLAAGVVGLVVLAKKSAATSTSASPNGPQPLRAGVPYLFIVRLDDGVTEEKAKTVLASKGASELVISPALNPPFWAIGLGVPFAGRHVSFKATPAGNGSVTLGEPFYDLGRLESLARLDGQPFTAEASIV